MIGLTSYALSNSYNPKVLATTVVVHSSEVLPSLNEVFILLLIILTFSIFESHLISFSVRPASYMPNSEPYI